MSILLFPAPPYHQYGQCSKYCWCILTICIYGRYMDVQTMVQFFFFWCCGSLFLNDMLVKMQYFLCSGGKNRVSMRDHDPWFIPYGYGMDDWVVFWCTMLVVEPKETLFTEVIHNIIQSCSIFSSNNQTTLENLWDKNDTNQNYLSQVMMNHQGWDGRRETQCSSTLYGC